MRSIALASAVVLAGLAGLIIACGGDGASPSPTATPRPRTDDIALCVDAVGVDDSIEAPAREIVAATVRDSTGRQATVEIGCPPPQFDPRDVDQRLEPGPNRHFVSEPSYYHAFVYLLPGETLQEWARYVNGEELIASGDVLETVTYGLYVRPEDLCDEVGLAALLEITLGLAGWEQYPDPVPPYFDPPLASGVTPTPTPTPCY